MCVAWCHDAFGHDITHVYLPSRIYTHDMTHSCIRFDSDWGLHTWQDSLMCVAWWHDALGHEPTHVYLPSRICTRAMTHSYTCHDSFIPVIRLIHTCEWLVHTCEWLIHTRDMTHSYAWHDSFIHVRFKSDWQFSHFLEFFFENQMSKLTWSVYFTKSDCKFLYVTWLTHVCVVHDAWDKTWLMLNTIVWYQRQSRWMSVFI